MASSEQKKLLSVLKTAIQMEADGKTFYLKAGEQSSNEAGKRLLSQLADEEDVHRRVFEQIYEALGNRKSWPEIEVRSHTDANTLFASEVQKMGKAKRAPSSEIEGSLVRDRIQPQ